MMEYTDEMELRNALEKKVIWIEEDKVIIDINKICEYNPKLADMFYDHTIDILVKLKEMLSIYDREFTFKFRNFKEEKSISDIRVNSINSILKIQGMINKVSKPFGIVTERKYECNICGTTITTKGDEPKRCSCGNKNPQFYFKDEIVDDLREIEIEEFQDSLEGKQPQKMRIRLNGILASPSWNNILQPGNKVEVIGVVKKIPLESKNKKLKESLYDYMIVALDFTPLDETFNEESISHEDEQIIMEIAADNPLKTLTESLAPSIYGHDEVKQALILQMVRGVKKKMPGGKMFRDRINLLLVGEPSTSKTTLAKAVKDRMPKSKYASGDSMTRAGMTFTVEKDELTGAWSLKGGLLCKCNGSTAIVDEIDKLSKEDIKNLHTPLESGEIPVNKAGIETTLRADCSVLAICNPKYGMFDIGGSKTLVEQIDLPSPILSRFDIVFMMKDKIEEKSDYLITEIIYSQKEITSSIPIELFRKYITYAKRINPVLNQGHLQRLQKFYHDIRKKSIARDSRLNGMPIGPRHLEGLIRLAEASAKIRLSNKVTEDDLKIAEDIFYNSLIKLGMDEGTGLIDIARMGSGTTVSKKSLMEKILYLLTKTNETGPISDKEFQVICEENGISSLDYNKHIFELNKAGEIIQTTEGWKIA